MTYFDAYSVLICFRHIVADIVRDIVYKGFVRVVCQYDLRYFKY